MARLLRKRNAARKAASRSRMTPARSSGLSVSSADDLGATRCPEVPGKLPTETSLEIAAVAYESVAYYYRKE